MRLRRPEARPGAALMLSRTLSLACVLRAAPVAMASPALAQTDVPLSGRLINALTGAPVGNATVVIEELKRETTSGPDGGFMFGPLAPGTYHMSVRADGYSSRRTE